MAKKYYIDEITKDNLIEYLVHTEGLSTHRASIIIQRIIDFLVINIISLNKIKISGLGTLIFKFVKERVAFIPKHKEKRTLPAKVQTSFTLEAPIATLLNKQTDRFVKIFNIEK